MNMLSSSTILIMLILLLPILMSMTNIIKLVNFPLYITSSIKYAFFLSLIPLTMFSFNKTEFMTSN